MITTLARAYPLPIAPGGHNARVARRKNREC
jgi:hypothetical protein